MSNTIKMALVVVAVAVSACAQQEEAAPLIVDVTPEAPTGKY